MSFRSGSFLGLRLFNDFGNVARRGPQSTPWIGGLWIGGLWSAGSGGTMDRRTVVRRKRRNHGSADCGLPEAAGSLPD